MENQLKSIEEIRSQFELGSPQRERLDYEWDSICIAGDAEYFWAWITEIKRARDLDFPATGVFGGRYCLCDYFYVGGTPNCSYLLYCAGVTKVDALKLNLPFERFINPMRDEIPELPIYFTKKNPKTNDVKLPDTDEELLKLLVERGELGAECLEPAHIIQSHGEGQPIQDILAETNGQLIWQEQFLHLLHTIGGYPYDEADCIRRDLAKKKFEELPALKENFINGAVKLGYECEDANELLDTLLEVSKFCHLKAHKMAVLLNT